MKDKTLNKPFTIYDIAREAGVSAGTASRALNNVGYVKNETKERITSIAKRMNYQPNRVAKSLKTKKTYQILLAIPDIDNQFYVELIARVHDVLKNNGYGLLLYFTGANSAIEVKTINMLNQHIADGLILINLNCTKEHIKAIKMADSPIVLSSISSGNSKNSAQEICDYVGVDAGKGVYIATNHLISQGHTRIGFIAGSVDLDCFRERYQGYKNALINHGYDIDSTLVYWGGYNEANGYLATKYFMEQENPPTAICSANDLMILGAMRACNEIGIKVPDDVALIGMDNIDIVNRVTPTISSVSLSQGEIGHIAAELILDRIEKNKSGKPQSIILEPRIVLRQSSVTVSSLK